MAVIVNSELEKLNAKLRDRYKDKLAKGELSVLEQYLVVAYHAGRCAMAQENLDNLTPEAA